MSEYNNLDHSINKLEYILKKLPCQAHISIDVCNDFVLPHNWSFTDRVNSNFHIAFVKSGEGAYVLGGKTVPIEKGKFIFVSSGFCHSRILYEKKLPRMVLVRFTVLNNQNNKPFALSVSPFAFTLQVSDFAKYYGFFGQLFHYSTSGLYEYSKSMSGIMLTLILHEVYSDIQLSSGQTVFDTRVKNVIAYMDNNINANITIDDMAEVVGLSKNYFRKLFYKQCGMNPKKYFIKRKIQHSLQLLTETDLMIKDIAKDLGYSDQYTFSKQFKAIVGVSPNNIRKERRQTD